MIITDIASADNPCIDATHRRIQIFWCLRDRSFWVVDKEVCRASSLRSLRRTLRSRRLMAFHFRKGCQVFRENALQIQLVIRPPLAPIKRARAYYVPYRASSANTGGHCVKEPQFSRLGPHEFPVFPRYFLIKRAACNRTSVRS